MNTSKRFAIQYFVVQFASGCIFPLLGLYLKELNFTGTQIGVLFSLSTFIGLLVNPIWGVVIDKIGRVKEILLVCMSVSALLCFALAFLTSYNAWLISIFFLYIFYSSLSLLNDTWCIKQGIEYGKARRWGSVGFAVASLTTGLLTLILDIRYFFFIFVFIMILGICSISLVKDFTAEKKETKKNTRIKLDRRIIIFFIGTFFVAGTVIVNINYFSLLYVEVGGSAAGVGLVFFLCALSEAPVMSVVNKFISKYGYEKLLMFVAVICMARWFWYGTKPSSILILAAFFLHGITCGIYVPAGIGYLKSIVDEDKLAGTLGIYSSVCSGISVLVFQYFGGYIIDKFNISKLYNLFGITCIISLCCYFILYKLKHKESKMELTCKV